jgi:hypothetical protein
MAPPTGTFSRKQAGFWICPDFQNKTIPTKAGDPSPFVFAANTYDPSRSYSANAYLLPSYNRTYPDPCKIFPPPGVTPTR